MRNKPKVYSPEEGRKLLSGEMKLPPLEKKNKFGAQKTVYNGVKYDSKLEARYAARLDLLERSGEIKKIDRQFKIELKYNDQFVCNYFIDFKVTYSDNRIEYHEVKGKATGTWRVKWKMAKAMHPSWNFVLITKDSF